MNKRYPNLPRNDGRIVFIKRPAGSANTGVIYRVGYATQGDGRIDLVSMVSPAGVTCTAFAKDFLVSDWRYASIFERISGFLVDRRKPKIDKT